MVNVAGDHAYFGSASHYRSCWASSVTENIESVWAIAGHPLVVLSEQQIVDCDLKSEGCNGGEPINAYEYVIKAGGLELNSVCRRHVRRRLMTDIPLPCQGWIVSRKEESRSCSY